MSKYNEAWELDMLWLHEKELKERTIFTDAEADDFAERVALKVQDGIPEHEGREEAWKEILKRVK